MIPWGSSGSAKVVGNLSHAPHSSCLFARHLACLPKKKKKSKHPTRQGNQRWPVFSPAARRMSAILLLVRDAPLRVKLLLCGWCSWCPCGLLHRHCVRPLPPIACVVHGSCLGPQTHLVSFRLHHHHMYWLLSPLSYRNSVADRARIEMETGSSLTVSLSFRSYPLLRKK